MLAPKCPTFNRRPTFANPMYLKKAQYEKPCLYEIQHDQSDPANRLIPDREEILTLEEESRSKLNKDLVKPYDYTRENTDLKYVESLEDEIESDKMGSLNYNAYIFIKSDEITGLQCLYLYKVRECDCLAQKLSEQTEFFAKKWRLLKITLQAPFLNVQKTFDRSRSSLGLHGNDV
ncbi:hypothetical protein Tco_1545650 [Tanacetum coccineum]